MSGKLGGEIMTLLCVNRRPESCWLFIVMPWREADQDTFSRRTGITLREGRRDEHGMEELDGMFSSPEKSPLKSNGIYNGNDTIIGSEGMSMDEGTYFANGFRSWLFSISFRSS